MSRAPTRRRRRAISGLAAFAGACGLAAALASVSAGAAGGPACAPGTLDASARLAGTPLLVTPAPGGRDAMPQTQISFLGAPAGQLSGLLVRGGLSGLHAGRLAAYAQGDGASFLPRTPFRIGESVTVSGSWTAATIAHPFAYSFTVGDPDRIHGDPR